MTEHIVEVKARPGGYAWTTETLLDVKPGDYIGIRFAASTADEPPFTISLGQVFGYRQPSIWRRLSRFLDHMAA